MSIDLKKPSPCLERVPLASKAVSIAGPFFAMTVSVCVPSESFSTKRLKRLGVA